MRLSDPQSPAPRQLPTWLTRDLIPAPGSPWRTVVCALTVIGYMAILAYIAHGISVFLNSPWPGLVR
jgi:hypothetical protein